MQRLLTADITATAEMPIKQGTLEFIQDSYKDPLIALSKSILGHNYIGSGYWAILGCSNVGVYPDYDIANGWILYNGDLYEVDAVAFTATGADVAVASISTTYLTAANADPVEFTDGNPHNVHQIKKIRFSAGASGSGIFDYSDLQFEAISEGIEVTYAANWDEGAGNKAKYRRNRDGLVTVQGAAFANGGGATINQDMFTLPTGFRPAEDIVIPGTYYDGALIYPCWLNVFTTGRVQSFNTITGTYANDDQINFSFSFYNS